jgi:WD40 repeat protein
VEWSNDGRFFVVGRYHAVGIFDATDYSLVRWINSLGRQSTVSISPDSKLFAFGTSIGLSGFDPVVELWDLDKLTKIKELEGHSGIQINQTLFSPDGQFLVSSNYYDTIIWDTRTWEPQFTLDGADGPIVFSPDGRFLAIAGSKVQVYDLVSGSPIEILSIIGGAGCSSIAFSPDNSSLVIGFRDGDLTFWDIQGYSEFNGAAVTRSFATKLWTISDFSDYDKYHPIRKSLQFAFNHDGTALLVANRLEGTLRELVDGEILWQQYISYLAADIALSPDGQTIAFLVLDRASIIDASNGDVIEEIMLPMSPIHIEFICPRRDEISDILEPNWGESIFGPSIIPPIIEANADPSVLDKFDIDSSLIEGELFNPRITLYTVSNSGDLIGLSVTLANPWRTRFVVTDKPINIEDPILRYDGNGDDWIYAIAFNHDNRLVSIAEGNSLITWDLSTKEQLGELEMLETWDSETRLWDKNFGDLIYTSDDILIGIGFDGYLYFADPVSSEWLGRIPVLFRTWGSLLLSPDNSQLALGTCMGGAGGLPEDGIIVIWGIP